MGNTDQTDRRRHERRPSRNPVEFTIQGDILDAVSVDVSDSGIRLDTERPVEISLRLGGDGEQSYDASLVWARRKLDGGMTYGFEYLPAPQT